MATDAGSPHFFRLLLFLHFRLPLLLFTRFLSLLRSPRRLRPPSLIVLRDLLLSLSFLRAGLVPVTLDLDAATSVHLWIPAHRRHGRPPLVLVHGFGGNSKWQWERQVGPLSASFDLYVPDLVFFGRSRSAKPDRSVEFQAECVAEAMRRLGVKRYSLCGISYGGFVAYRMAAAAAGVVERVVILSAGVCTTAEQRAEMVAREDLDVFDVLLPRRPEDLMALMRRSMHRPPRWVPTFLLADFIQVMYKVNRKERVETLQELLNRGTGVEPLPVLAQETLLIWGDRDDIFPLCLAHQLKSHLGVKSKLEIVKDAGHALQLESFQRVNHLIQSFVLGQRI
ncbi:hypothetical protein Taro_044659 [Colocasia esculenta]|uniref:AB hydrolase-1 domain-containing protein n=1 Tax=Colocasia esculenta TaxID=4460 RepID=A0A843WYQ8_COLES|nr:hypothetical protein [Colocasia esculenta]